MTCSPPATAPKDGTPFLGQFEGRPGSLPTVWNKAAGVWSVAEVEKGSHHAYEAATYFKCNWFYESMLTGWMKYPGINLEQC